MPPPPIRVRVVVVSGDSLAIVSRLGTMPGMAKLDLHPLKDFCSVHNQQELWEFVSSYVFRDRAALYHLSNIRDRLEIAGQPSNIHKIAKVESEIRFEIDALMLTLNSMFAIAAQIVNEAVLRPKLSTAKVGLEELTQSTTLPDDFRRHFVQLRGSHVYSKIRTYSNISKHIKVVGGQLNVDFRQDITQVDYKTDEFNVKEPMVLSIGDLEECRKFTKESIEGLIALVSATLLSTS